MTYNVDLTASRIRAAREAGGYTLAQVAESCGVQQYQTVSKWEKGNSVPSIENLFKLCELFNCELGYLLGEHEGRTRVATDIHEKTGLSFRAIDELERIRANNPWFAIQALNALLEEDVCNTLDLIGHYQLDKSTDTILPNGDRVPTKSILMIAIQRSLDRIEAQHQ